MATVNSTEYAAELAGTIQDPKHGGNVQVKHGTCEASSQPDGDAMQMVALKAGDVVVDVLLCFDALGTNLVMNVGIGSDTDLFIDGIDVTAESTSRLSHIDGVFYEMTSDDTIDCVLEGTGTGSGTVTLTVFYIPVGG